MKSHKLSQTKSEHATIFQFISEICLFGMIDEQIILHSVIVFMLIAQLWNGFGWADNACTTHSMQIDDVVCEQAITSWVWPSLVYYDVNLHYFIC